MLRVLILMLITCSPVIAASANDPDFANLVRQPVGFIQNQGQVLSMETKKPAEMVLYHLRGSGVDVFIRKDGISYLYTNVIQKTLKEDDPYADCSSPERTEWMRIDLLLEGISPDVKITAEEPSEYYENFYLPAIPNGSLHNHAYNRLVFHDVYPGIDWVIYLDENKNLKYDFKVQAGADPSLIAIRYKYTEKPVLLPNGDLYARGPMGEITDGAPIAFQKGTDVTCAWQENPDGTFGFNLTGVKNDRELIIDPIIQWATYYGGSLNDFGYSIRSDGANVYITGALGSVNFPVQDPGGGFFQGTHAGGSGNDAFLIKFNTLGVRQWCTYYGGTGDDIREIMDINTTSIFITGSTLSSDFPTFNPGGGAYYQAALGAAGMSDAFLIQFNKNGVRQWATYLGGNFWDAGFSVDCNDNHVFVAMLASSSDMPTVDPGGGAFMQTTLAASNDGFIAKFTTAGVPVWMTYYGGASDEDAFPAIATNGTDIYFTGGTTSADFPVLNPGGVSFYQGSLTGSKDAYFVRFSYNGNRIWSTYLGGTGDESFRSIGFAGTDVLFGGYTTSTNILTADPGGAWMQTTNGGNADGYMVRINTDNEILWATYCGGLGNDYFYNLNTDTYNAWLTGRTYSNNFPTVNPGMGNYFQATRNGPVDMFIMKFKLNGNLRQWSTYYGGTASDEGWGIHSDNVNLWMTGFSNSANMYTLNPGGGAWFQASPTSAYDMAILKFDVCIKPDVQISPALPVICQFDTVTLVATGAVSYIWNTLWPDDTLSIMLIDTTQFFVTGTDDMACLNNDTVNVIVNPLPNVQITGEHPICYGDTITLFANNAVNYLWAPVLSIDTSITVHPDSTSAYILGGIDAHGCRNVDTATVIVYPLPIVQITGEHPICFGDSITLTGIGASVYHWEPVAIDDTTILVHPDSTSFYYILGTDTNGCMNRDTATVVVWELPNVFITGNHPICFGDSLELTANGASVYHWEPVAIDDTSIIVAPPITSTYIVLGTDTNNCRNYDTTTVTVWVLPNVFITGAQPICYGDSITLFANGANTYVWENPLSTDTFITIAPVDTTDFILIGTDTNLCVNSDTVTVDVWQLPPVALLGAYPICYGDSIDLAAVGAVTYEWTPGGMTGDIVTIHPDTTTIFEVLGTDIHGCKNTDTSVVVVYALPNVYISGHHPICFGDSIPLFANGAVTYEWFPSQDTTDSVVVTPPITSTYILVGTDQNFCVNSDTASVIVYTLPNVEILDEHPICYGDSIMLTAGGAINYTWYPMLSTEDSVIVQPDTSSSYILVGVDFNNCVNSDTAEVVVWRLPPVMVSGVEPMCFGDSVTITAHGAHTYLWTPVGTTDSLLTVSPAITTDYLVTGTDTNMCVASAAFTVIVYPLPVAAVSGINHICFSEITQLTATGGADYLWSTGDTTATIIVSPGTTTTYSLIAHSNICYDTTYYEVIVDPKPVLTISNDTTLIIGTSTQLNASGADYYIWSPASDLSCVACPNPVTRPFESVEYCVIGTNTYGCGDTACVYITIDDECGEVFVPSAFSPNGDGMNDMLMVYGKCIRIMEFKVYNRWGEKVYESTDPTTGWDGSFRGTPLDTDVFIYYLKAEYYIDQTVERKGNITLMR